MKNGFGFIVFFIMTISLMPLCSSTAAGTVRPGSVSAADGGFLLHSDDFSRDLSNWTVEQMPGGRVFVEDGRLIIEDAAGCTVWFNEVLQAPVRITYEVSVSGLARVSDLNCFWMATDPSLSGCLFDPAHKRTGQFSTYNTLRTYYVGYGGNNNSTTRFRRYPGDGTRPIEPANDLQTPEFLLRADHPYRIELVASNGKVQYIRDGEVIFDVLDPEPLAEGRFGFRTVNSRLEIRNVRVYEADSKDGVK